MKPLPRSALHELIVEEENGIRLLQFGDTVQSSLRIGDESAEGLSYCELFHLPLALHETIGRVLFIGLGGATGPRQFLFDYPEVSIDVVEIDPAVVDVARTLFGFEESDRCRVHVDDGLIFLQRTRQTWDLIVVDAYSTEEGDLVIPVELTTPQFFSLCAKRMRRGGIVLFNCAAAPSDLVSREIAADMRGAFENLIAFALPGGENTVLIASAAALPSTVRALEARVLEAIDSGRISRKRLIERCRELVMMPTPTPPGGGA